MGGDPPGSGACSPSTCVSVSWRPDRISHDQAKGRPRHPPRRTSRSRPAGGRARAPSPRRAASRPGRACGRPRRCHGRAPSSSGRFRRGCSADCDLPVDARVPAVAAEAPDQPVLECAAARPDRVVVEPERRRRSASNIGSMLEHLVRLVGIHVDRIDERAGHVVVGSSPASSRSCRRSWRHGRSGRCSAIAPAGVSRCGYPPFPPSEGASAGVRVLDRQPAVRDRGWSGANAPATRRRRTRRRAGAGLDGGGGPGGRGRSRRKPSAAQPRPGSGRDPISTRPSGGVRRRPGRGRRDRGGGADGPRDGRGLPGGGGMPAAVRSSSTAPCRMGSSSFTSSRDRGYGRRRASRHRHRDRRLRLWRGRRRGAAGHAGTTLMDVRDDALRRPPPRSCGSRRRRDSGGGRHRRPIEADGDQRHPWPRAVQRRRPCP